MLLFWSLHQNMTKHLRDISIAQVFLNIKTFNFLLSSKYDIWPKWKSKAGTQKQMQDQYVSVTIISIFILSSKVHTILQQHRANSGQVLLGSQM